MKSVKESARNNIDSNKMWLYTKHINLYERFSWEYSDTYNKEKNTKII